MSPEIYNKTAAHYPGLLFAVFMVFMVIFVFQAGYFPGTAHSEESYHSDYDDTPYDGAVYKAPAGGNRGLTGNLRLYDNSYAIVIGINKYETLPELSGAVNDADEVAKVLMQQDFTVEKLLDSEANLMNIKEKLGDKLPGKLGKNDRVLVYFAGHGASTGAKETALGYLLPVGGDKQRLRSTGISMRELQDWFADYQCKHVMFIADACYSGLALSTRSIGLPQNVMDYMLQVTRKPVRVAMTAGGSNEEAHEWRGHGLFTYYFLEAIKGRGQADANGDGILTSDEMMGYIKPQVSQTALSRFRKPQTPHSERSGEGEFLFVLPDLYSKNSGTAAKKEPEVKKPDPAVLEKERQNRLYQDNMTAAWNELKKTIDNPSADPGKKIELLNSFKNSFPLNNPYMESAEKSLAAEKGRIAEKERQNRIYQEKLAAAWSETEKTLGDQSTGYDEKISAVTSFKNSFPSDNPYIAKADKAIAIEKARIAEKEKQGREYQDRLNTAWNEIENAIDDESLSYQKKIALINSFKNDFPANNPYLEEAEQKIRQEKGKFYQASLEKAWLEVEEAVDNDSVNAGKRIALISAFKKNFPVNNPYTGKADSLLKSEEKKTREQKKETEAPVASGKVEKKKEFVPLPSL